MGKFGTKRGPDSGDRGRRADGLKIVDYHPSFRDGFRELNLAWIERDYGVEPADRTVLDHPEEHILGIGGEILIACAAGTVVGTCALVPHGEQLELEKMTVAEDARGRGIGRLLLEAALNRARARGAPTLRLDTSTKAKAAIHLYRSLGFRPVERTTPSVFARSDLTMELQLNDDSDAVITAGRPVSIDAEADESPYKTLRFDAGKIPKGLLQNHQLKEGVRGELRVTAGSLVFVDSREKRTHVSEGDVILIPSGAAHHLEEADSAAIELMLFEVGTER